MHKKKILLISHNPVGGATSSGRTIETFITNATDVDYFNLYISNESLNLLDRVEYFQLSERQLIKGGRLLSETTDSKRKSSVGPRIKERSKIYINRIISSLKKRYRWHFQIIRECVWRLMYRRKDKLCYWLEEIEPDIIVVYPGDFLYFYKICRSIMNDSTALVVFNSEDYISFEKKSSFISSYKHSVSQAKIALLDHANHIFQSNSKLRKYFNGFVSSPSSDLYTTSSLLYQAPVDKPSEKILRFLYAGNLVHGRLVTLLELADVLCRYSLNAKIRVFSANVLEKDAELLLKHSKIEFLGRVDYSQILREIGIADVVLHVESFCPVNIENVKFGFSTKLADLICCGRPILVIGPRQNAGIEYLIEHRTGHVVYEKEELPKVVEALINDEFYRVRFYEVNRFLAVSNHSKEVNTKKIWSVFGKLLNDEK